MVEMMLDAAQHFTAPLTDERIAHLWIVTIHPFDDANGRMTRAMADWQLGTESMLEAVLRKACFWELAPRACNSILDSASS